MTTNTTNPNHGGTATTYDYKTAGRTFALLVDVAKRTAEHFEGTDNPIGNDAKLAWEKSKAIDTGMFDQ